MCHERERLIAYIYNECDASERELVQGHLDTCAECRAEVGGLRSVREDLFAWDVPAHESVWRPFAPAPVVQWWRQVPAWAVATAAGVVILSGAAGGAVLHAFLPEQTVARQTEQTATATPTQVSIQKPEVTKADLTAAEQRWLVELREQFRTVDAQVRKASFPSQALRGVESDHTALSNEAAQLREENTRLFGIVNSLVLDQDRRLKGAELKNADLQTQIKNLQSIVSQLIQVK